MLLHELRKGMVIHHTLRTKVGAGGIVVPIKAQVGGVSRIWEEDVVIVTLREGSSSPVICGSTAEVKEELQHWHEGTGFDCLVCSLAIEQRLSEDAAVREEIERNVEEAAKDQAEQLQEIAVG